MSDATDVLKDFVVLAENEIQRIKTGHAPGPSMRDCIGQWQATVREAKALLQQKADREARWLANPDYPYAD